MDSKKLPITGPCPIDLDGIGFDRKAKKAFCGHCSKNVVNLSNFSRDEAREFLRDHAGETMCVSYARGPEGQIKFKPEAPLVPLARLRTRPPRRSTAAAATAAAGLALALAACTPHSDDAPKQDRTEQVDHDGTKTIIPIIDSDPDPDPIPLAGMMVVPPEETVEGNMPIPEDIMIDGEVEIPQDDGEETQPCDGKPKADVDTTNDRPTKTRGRIRLPRTDEL